MTTYIKRVAHGSIILVGEYVVDSFFSELHTKEAKSILKDKNKLEMLIQFSRDYGHIFVIPVIQYKNKGFYKQMALIANGDITYYTQQRLISYPHWNECDFFSNDTKKIPKLPLVFNANGIKFGVLFGFEAHFDEFWMELKKANVDAVLVSTASTFKSKERWRNLLSTHAFTNSCYVFRANRIGTHKADDGNVWEFYGDSFVSLGHDIVDCLDDNEGMLCVEIDKNMLSELKLEWGFR